MIRTALFSALMIGLLTTTSKADLVQVFGPNDSASGVGSSDSLFNSIVQRASDNAYAVGQAKYRGASNNFNMSFDNGVGTNVGTSINQTVSPRTGQLFSFSEQHYYSNSGGPNGFVFQMQKVQGDQGQRTLKFCSRKDFQQEGFVPAAATAFHGEAVATGMLFQQ